MGFNSLTYDEYITSASPGPSSRSRRSALRARRSLSALNPRSHNPTDTLEKATKTMQTIKRRRKHRHAKLRDMARENEEGVHGQDSRSLSGGEVMCPICLVTVRGDQDVLDAHIDACLANEGRREEQRLQEAELQRAGGEDLWGETYDGGAAGHIGDVRGILSVFLAPPAMSECYYRNWVSHTRP